MTRKEYMRHRTVRNYFLQEMEKAKTLEELKHLLQEAMLQTFVDVSNSMNKTAPEINYWFLEEYRRIENRLLNYSSSFLTGVKDDN